MPALLAAGSRFVPSSPSKQRGPDIPWSTSSTSTRSPRGAQTSPGCHGDMEGLQTLTQEEELPAVPVEAQELSAVFLHRRAQPVLAEQHSKLLDLLR